MPRNKKALDSDDSVSDPSEGEVDSDDSMFGKRGPPKKRLKKEQPKSRAPPKTPKRASPKKKKRMEEEEEVMGNQIDEDEDNEQRNLIIDYDEEDLLNIVVPDAPKPCMKQEGGERLIITDIFVENFKSYYGKRRIGPFHHSFTSIIGPNGSGKSNVIDALLFVFGYKASKIRSKKVSVLIHSSAGREDLDSCTVRISFQKIIDVPPVRKGGDSTYTVVPNSAFNVSRTAYKNNTSDYKLDGQKTTFKEVATRLKKEGIDLIHNRFLILQGEVEQIAMMKPKSVNGSDDGMLEYLEDIIGSSRYKVPIEKLSSKLEKLQVERSHQITKVNTANREKIALDEPVKHTLEYLITENEIGALSCKQHLLKKYQYEKKAQAIYPQLTECEDHLKDVSTELDEVLAQLEEKRATVASMDKKLVKTKTAIHTKTNEYELLVVMEKRHRNDLDRINNELKKLHAEVKKEKEKLEKAKRAPEEAKIKIKQLNIKLAEYKDEYSTEAEQFDANYPKFFKKTEADRAKKAKLEEDYSSVAERLAEADSKCKVAESALASLQEEYEKKRKQIDELDGRLSAVQKQVDKEMEARTKYQSELDVELKRRKDAREEMDPILPRITEIKKRMDELQPLLYSEQQMAAKERIGLSAVTKAFIDAQKNGRMNGWMGRLGDLGSIDAKYDKAISNNFGALDYHLVDTQRTANEGSEVLKPRGMRSKFLALDRQQSSWQHIKRLQKEKHMTMVHGVQAQRLFNLIDCEDRYKPAFYFCVRYAYVVNTLDDAQILFNALAADGKRETVVSLDGNQISRNGSYIGGGCVKEGKINTGKQARKAASTYQEDSEAAKKQAEATAEKEQLEKELHELSQRKRSLEYTVNNLAQPIANKEHAIVSLNKAIKVNEERLRVHEQQKADKERELEKARVADNEVARREQEIDQLRQDRETIAEDSKSFKDRMKAIDNDMQKVFNKLCKPHQEARDSARDEIATIEKELSEQQATINGAERNILKQQKRVESIDKDMDSKRGKNIEINRNEENNEKNKTERKEELAGLQSQVKELEAQLKDLRASTITLDTQEVRLTKEKKLLQEKGESLAKHMKACRHSADNHEAEAESIQLHNISQILCDIPEEMCKEVSETFRIVLDGESESDDDEDVETSSPSKAKVVKESRKSQNESPRKKKKEKKKKVAVEGEEEGEGQNEEADDEEETAAQMDEEEEQEGEDEEEEEDGDDDVQMIDEEPSGAGNGDDVAMEEERRKPESQEERMARKLQKKRERRRRQEEMLKNGLMPEWSRRQIVKLKEAETAEKEKELRHKLEALKKKLQSHILEDYKKKVEKLRREGELLTIIKDKYTAHRDKLDDLKKHRLAEFMGGFESISTALRELYQMITLGGDASLELKDVLDPFIEGVQFMVRPPKKSWKQIENLSGGEKTLSSLALVFALHKYRPTPLYVMDEIDAALDFRNVSIIGHYIKDRTKNAQFIIISLRNNMFELADRLIGIYKVHDCTRNVVVDPKKVLEETKELRNGLNKVRMLMESHKNLTGAGL